MAMPDDLRIGGGEMPHEVSPLHGVAPEAASAGHPVWGEIAPELRAEEFHHPERMDTHFLRLLARVRRRAGVPFRIVSDYRSREQNRDAGGASRSAHMDLPCRAVDLHVTNNEERFRVVEAALALGFVRIGVYPARTDNSGSIHIDAAEANPAPRIWTRY
jgi:uncharacterized protein YcbK (DUF882 family)